MHAHFHTTRLARDILIPIVPFKWIHNTNNSHVFFSLPYHSIQYLLLVGIYMFIHTFIYIFWYLASFIGSLYCGDEVFWAYFFQVLKLFSLFFFLTRSSVPLCIYKISKLPSSYDWLVLITYKHSPKVVFLDTFCSLNKYSHQLNQFTGFDQKFNKIQSFHFLCCENGFFSSHKTVKFRRLFSGQTKSIFDINISYARKIWINSKKVDKMKQKKLKKAKKREWKVGE